MSASDLTVNELLALPNVIEAERKQRGELEARLKTENDLVAKLLHDLEAERAAGVQKDARITELLKLLDETKARASDLSAELMGTEVRCVIIQDNANRLAGEMQKRINELQNANRILECQLRALQAATAQVMQDARASAESVKASAASVTASARPEISAAAEGMVHVISGTEIAVAVPAPTADAKIAALEAETADLRKHMCSVIAHLQSTGAYLPGYICKDGFIHIEK